MALAERRPQNIGFQVGSTPASPAFNTTSLNASSNNSNASNLKSSGSTSSITLDIGNTSSDNIILEEDEDDLMNDELNHNIDEEDEDDEDVQSPISILNQSHHSYISNHQNLEKSVSPEAMSPTSSRSISPDSLMQGGNDFKKLSLNSRGSTPPTSTSTPPSSQTNNNNAKKPKNPSRAPIATGISTTIPVTGEKPRPDQKDDASLEDDVLYAIFVILFEKDPEGSGMTVKQICDILIEQHPDMANLSTKTSNLVSAKLNAYVKRVEKGDTSLKYALSRDWADASPKRMVYVYRGILTEDFHVHVKKLMEIQKQEQQAALKLENDDNSNLDGSNVTSTNASPKSSSTTSSTKKSKQEKLLLQQQNQQQQQQQLAQQSQQNFSDSSSLDDPLEAGKQATLSKPRRQTMYDLGISKHTFLDATSIDKSNLFVPYNSAPVTASLTESNLSTISEHHTKRNSSNNSNGTMMINHHESDFDFEDFEVFQDDDEEDDDDAGLLSNNPHSFSNDLYIESFKKNGKRSKSLSYLSLNKKSKILTAAAAAPRAPRTPSSHNANAAAAAADLHAAALRAISNPELDEDSNTSDSSSTVKDSESSAGSVPSNKKWLEVIRSGFLSLDIGAPEDISLSDLDKFFN
ncbi:hypothetical protein DFJ63DRAFT_334525 [Scheffersomyces coipomensis]|uniref:uncharacterized protein n=1 Tax=Scheffersomyces coipomensis TaxID=1788519 RepID=UPI00315D33EE